MVRSLIRALTLICLLIGMGIYAGINSIPLIVCIVSMCAWLAIRDINDIGGWIIMLSACISIGWYDRWGVIFLIVIAAAHVFHIAHVQLARSHNSHTIVLFVTALSIAFIAQVAVNVIYTRYIGYDMHHYVTTIFVSLVSFLLFMGIIQKSERFIDLYVHDTRGHT